jgi:hypothetical protein
VRASEADLAAQFELATRVTDALAVTYDSFLSLKELRALVSARMKALADGQITKKGGKARSKAAGVIDAVQAFDKKLDVVQNGTNAAPGMGVVNRDLARYFEMLVSGDARPAERLRASVAESCQALAGSLASWRNLQATAAALNKLLVESKQEPFAPIAVPETTGCRP